MKKLTVILIATLFSFNAFANDVKPVKETKSELRAEIVQLLGDIEFDLDKNLTGTVEFVINNRGELIIVNVDSKDTNVELYVKRQLNYKHISTKAVVKGRIYKMPLKIVKKS